MQSNTLRCQKRLQKELEDLEKYKDTFFPKVDEKNPCRWTISFKGAEGTLYNGEEFTLQFKFSSEYVKQNII
jgi:ubiquitin-conjugating enzyme E2 W